MSIRSAIVLLLLLMSFHVAAATIVVSEQNTKSLLEAIARAQAGDIVSLPPGTFPISEVIFLKSGIVLAGSGPKETTLVFEGDAATPLVSVANCVKTEIRDLTLDGRTNPNALQGIGGSRAKEIRIHNVTVRNLGTGTDHPAHGILFAGVSPTRTGGVTDSEVSGCHFENIGVKSEFGCAIRFSWGSSRNRIIGNTIVNTGRGGIFADNGATDIVIRGNTVSGSGGEGLGIEVWGGCDRSVIEDNRIDHWLSIGGCDYCTARRNTVSEKSGTYKFCGIEVIGSYNIVTDNTVDGGQKVGISVSNAQPKNYVFFGRNTVRGCNQWGTQFQGESGGILCHYFHQCVFTGQPLATGPVWFPGCEGNGFRFNGNCRRMTFEECTFSKNGSSGIQFLGNIDLLNFVRCSIQDNGGFAATPLSEYTGLEWSACTISGNASNEIPAAKPLPGKAFTAAFDCIETGKSNTPIAFANTTPGFAPGWTALWDFDEGPAVSQSGENLPPINHTYARPGKYRVTLIVWDNVAHASRAERIVSISEK